MRSAQRSCPSMWLRLGLAGWLCMVGLLAQAGGLVQERLLTLQVDRSVRLGLGLYSDGRDLVLHLHQGGDRGAERLVDLRTGQSWAGSPSAVLSGFTALPMYQASAEPRGSYLERLGCRRYQDCSSLESSDALVMWRSGRRPEELEVRVLDFFPLFQRVERLLAGQADLAAGDVGEAERVALEEAGRRNWRLRFIDAIRSTRSLDAVARLDRGVNYQLRQMAFFTQDLNTLDSLEREWESAGCRTLMDAMADQVLAASGDVNGAATRFGNALDSCADKLVVVVDALAQRPADDRRRLVQRLAARARQQRDVAAALRFIDPDPHSVHVRQAEAPPMTRAAASGASVPRRSEASVSRAAAAQVETAPDADPLVELQRIRAEPNKIRLLAFDERSGVTRVDAADQAGTVFVARALGQITDGRFVVETFNRRGAPVQFKVGAYAVRVRVVLDWTRNDRCNGIKCLLTGEAPSRDETRSDARELEFQLLPGNQYRQERQVLFQGLMPRDYEESGRYTRTLKELRLSVVIRGITPL